MTRKEAQQASPIQYAKRYASDRGVTLYASGHMVYAEIAGALHPVKLKDDTQDWEPILPLLMCHGEN